MSTQQDRLDAAMARIPYVRFLGLRCELAGDEMTAILPFGEHLIGNTTIPALHGGVVGAFLDPDKVQRISPPLPPEVRIVALEVVGLGYGWAASTTKWRVPVVAIRGR